MSNGKPFDPLEKFGKKEPLADDPLANFGRRDPAYLRQQLITRLANRDIFPAPWTEPWKSEETIWQTGVGSTQLFMQGLKGGLLHPFQVITGKQEKPLESETAGEAFAEFLGEMIGMGISFIPFFGAARWAIGLPAAGFGYTMTSRHLATRALEGGLSFGLFEAGAAATGEPEEIAKRFAGGFAAGAIMDPGLTVLGRGLLRRFGKEVKEVGPWLRKTDLHSVDPTVLAVERMLSPEISNDPAELISKINALGTTVDDQLDDQLARVLRATPSGQFVLSGVRYPERLYTAIERNIPGAKIHLRVDPNFPELYEVGIFTPGTLRRWSEAGRLLRKATTFEEAVKIVEAGVGINANRWAAPPVEVSIGTKRKLGLPTGRTLGQVDVLKNPYLVKILKRERLLKKGYDPATIDLMQRTILGHEYTHLATWWKHGIIYPSAQTRAQYNAPARFTPREWADFKKLHPGAEMEHLDIDLVSMFRPYLDYEPVLLGYIYNVGTHQEIDAAIAAGDRFYKEIIDELRKITAEQTKRISNKNISLPTGVTEGAAYEEWKAEVVDRWIDYLGQPMELLGRVVELMVVSPEEVARIAPNVTRIMKAWIADNNAVIASMLPDDSVAALAHGILTSSWVAKGAEFTFFQAHMPKLPKFAAEQFKKWGYWTGMGVRWGKDNRWYDWRRGRVVAGGRREFQLWDPETRTLTDWIPEEEVFRPVVGRMVERNNETLQAVRGVLQRSQEWVTTIAYVGERTVPGTGTPVQSYGPVKLDLSKMLQVEDILKHVRNDLEFNKWLGRNLETYRMLELHRKAWEEGRRILSQVEAPTPQDVFTHLFTALEQLPEVVSGQVARGSRPFIAVTDLLWRSDKTTPTEALLSVYRKYMREAGMGGIYQKDLEGYQVLTGFFEGVLERGAYEYSLPYTRRAFGLGKEGAAFIARPDVSDLEFIPHTGTGFFQSFEIPMGSKIVRIPFRDAFRSKMLEIGIPDSDVKYWFEIAKEEAGKLFVEAAPPEAKAMFEGAKAAAEGASKMASAAESVGGAAKASTASLTDEGLENAVRGLGLRVEGAGNGRYRLMNEDRVTLGTFANKEEVLDFVGNTAIDAADDIGDVVSLPQSGNPVHGGGHSPFQGVLFTARNLRETAENIWLATPVLSALEKFARAAESRGIGHPWRAIMRPTQAGAQAAREFYAHEPIEELGGKTLSQAFRELEKLVRFKVRWRKKWEQIANYMEYMTQDEVVKSILSREMFEHEIKMGNMLRPFKDELYQLMQTNRSIKAFLRGREAFNGHIMKLRRMGLYDVPENERVIRALAESFELGNVKNELDAFRAVGYVGREGDKRILVTKQLEWLTKQDPSNYSAYAVIRYAQAPVRDPKFLTGRAQYAAEVGMDKYQLEAVAQIEKILNFGFRMSGIDGKRFLGGYWPHMRAMARVGLTADEKEFFKFSYEHNIKWMHDLLRLGELDIYSKDPVMVPYKYIQGLLNKRFLNGPMKEASKALKRLRSIEILETGQERVYSRMNEYLKELRGIPHTSFQSLNGAIKWAMGALGVNVSNRVAQDIINAMTVVTYSATIPFRPALVFRNYFQIMQMVAPKTGMGPFWEAVQYVFSPKTMRKAITEARAAGAVTPNVAPVMATTELAGPFGGLGGKGIPLRMRLVSDVGFKIYQSADDYGRAIAYHAQKIRLAKAQGRYMGGQFGKGEGAFEKFLEEAGVRIFDLLDQEDFIKLYRAGRFEEAGDLLGHSLARSTIFRYGLANHPAGWHSPFGRLFGQFGTWPIQYKDFLMDGLAYGTRADKARFLMSHSAINFAVLGAGAAAGLNLTNWLAFGSVFYTGGPYFDIAMDLLQVLDGSPAERRLAMESLKLNLPSFENPASILVPGSYAVSDAVRSIAKYEGIDQLWAAMGFRPMKPDDFSMFNDIIEKFD